ncbi:MAG TPA: DUF4178 domain-containing protein, partial [Turneriella sp.]|nr:DUF4178 domain-containing protein [Turneriella sp.]
MNERVDESLAPKESASVAAKDFRCPNCGGPVHLALPGKSQSVRCGHCGSILEPTHDVLLLRQKYEKAFSHKQWIPLSQEGVLKGIKFKCVGIVVRKDNYGGSWTEYLIFNPYHGYRYLVESSGHWTYVEQLANVGYTPNNEPAWDGFSLKINFAGKKFKYATGYKATVKNVIGEFPWEVIVGEKNAVTEYLNPPYQATCERVEGMRDGKSYTTESNWSLGEYVYPKEIQQAFNLEEMPPRMGFGMCEPNPYKKRRFFALLWSAALFFFASATCVISSNRSENAKVIDKVLPLNIANFELKKDGTTEYLEFDHEEGTIQLSKETNIEFEFSIPLSQQWISLNVFLIDEVTGKLRHDRWKDKGTGRWTGKVFIAIDPGEGS